jgi:hypothetical protein
MNKELSFAPKSKTAISSLSKLSLIFERLINQPFILTGKTRTDGANIRKLIGEALVDNGLPLSADNDTCSIIPPKKKGVPKLLIELIDTYIVTSGSSYNLQVWNRFPNSESALIEYSDGSVIRCNDIRYVFVKINPSLNLIESIVILTPEFIEDQFGNFGKPTIKHQLLISQRKRNEIVQNPERILFESDTLNVKRISTNSINNQEDNFNIQPTIGKLYTIEYLKTIFLSNLIGFKVNAASTKNRGQLLEEKCLSLLDYQKETTKLLEGGYPDIRNQLLEIKIQDTQTIDLGKYSPEYEEIIIADLHLTTKDVRYLIALADKDDMLIKGLILMPGTSLGKYFTFVSGTSFKCQRSIPMSFFEKLIGQSVCNP